VKTIKDLPEHNRPREKLRERGAAALTDEELVAAILGRGTSGIDVRTMARQVAGLIREHKENLTLAQLTAVPGIKHHFFDAVTKYPRGWNSRSKIADGQLIVGSAEGIPTFAACIVGVGGWEVKILQNKPRREQHQRS